MGVWKWEGLDKNGKKTRGQYQAKTERDVRKHLRSEGVRAKKIIAPTMLEFDFAEWMVEKGFAASFSNKELCQFTKQFHVMISAGVPILQALEILYKSEKNPTLKHALKGIAQEVGEGKTLAEAMAKQKGFSRMYCNLIKAGEAGGVLDTILQKLAMQLERQEGIKNKVKSAMTYPVIASVVGVGVVWGLMVFIVPKFMEMLSENNQEPPFITQLVVNTSKFFQEYTPVMIPSAIAGYVFFNYWKKSPLGKPIWDRIVMNTPIFGGVVLKGNLASFSRTLSTMLSSGVALIDSIEISMETIDHTHLIKDLRILKKAVTEGQTFSEPLSRISYIPTMVAQMVKVGEQTGRIDEMLERVADVFEEEVNRLIENLTKLIEPFIIVVLGGAVAVVLIAMYLPIFMTAGGGDDEAAKAPVGGE